MQNILQLSFWWQLALEPSESSAKEDQSLIAAMKAQYIKKYSSIAITFHHTALFHREFWCIDQRH